MIRHDISVPVISLHRGYSDKFAVVQKDTIREGNIVYTQ